MKLRDKIVDVSGRTCVMGVLNVTPDSFSDGALDESPGAAAERALRMIADGADLLDVGGESTRPGSSPVPADVQVRRVLPVVAEIRRSSRAPLTIDTRCAHVAEATLDAGADGVNDVSAGQGDPRMFEVVRTRGAGLILMHMLGQPQTMQQNPQYTDVITEVKSFLAKRVRVAEAAGISREHLAVDPGIGFGKTTEHNLTLLARVAEFHELGLPVVVGTSRKRFIGDVLGIANPRERLLGTAATVAGAVLAGVQIVRVHDVREMRQVVEMAAAIRARGA
jgi:dihydropteroate synthase